MDKPDYSLLPVEPLDRMVKVLTIGAKGKHAIDGWKNETMEFHFNKALRHLIEWRMGVAHDIETGESPLVHSAARLFFIIWMEIEKAKQFKPLPLRGVSPMADVVSMMKSLDPNSTSKKD